MKYVLKPLSNSVLIPLGLTVGGSGSSTSSTNKEMEHIMKIVKYLELRIWFVDKSKQQLKMKRRNKRMDFCKKSVDRQRYKNSY